MEILLTALAEFAEKKAALIRKESEQWENLAGTIKAYAQKSSSREKLKQDYDPQKQNFLTVRQLAEKYPAFSQGGLRHNIFHAEKNGLAKCLRRLGRKVLIDEKSFLQWIDKDGALRR